MKVGGGRPVLVMNVLVSTLGWASVWFQQAYAKILIVRSTAGSLVRCQTFRLQHKNEGAARQLLQKKTELFFIRKKTELVYRAQAPSELF